MTGVEPRDLKSRESIWHSCSHWHLSSPPPNKGNRLIQCTTLILKYSKCSSLFFVFVFCRIQSQNPESEMDNYASFINEALDKTKCRECVPCWEEIQTLMNRQKMLCTVHYPGPGSCQLYISSHTTASEVWEPSILYTVACSGCNFQKTWTIFICSSLFTPEMNHLRVHSSFSLTRWCGGCRRSSGCKRARTHLHCTSRIQYGSSQWPVVLWLQMSWPGL